MKGPNRETSAINIADYVGGGLNDYDTGRSINVILEMAKASDIKDQEAIDGIVNKLQSLHESHLESFADIFDTVDPDQNNSETKLLSDLAKDRLNKAIEQFKQNTQV